LLGEVDVTGIAVTSAGHLRSDADHLDRHFKYARAEYEASLQYVGIQPGWNVLDAGCGGGNFLPLISAAVGSTGKIFAVDLAPENVYRAAQLAKECGLAAPVHVQTGNIVKLPFDDGAFDCVWSANVMQYLSEEQFQLAVGEFKRVLKPRGVLAVKEKDTGILQMLSVEPDLIWRLFSARRAAASQTALLGPWSGSSIPGRLHRSGLEDVERKGWLVERWAPFVGGPRRHVEAMFEHFAAMAERHDVPPTDKLYWRAVADNPGTLLDTPDFCIRELFVVAKGRTVEGRVVVT
jgi:arsenite methyltransferase